MRKKRKIKTKIMRGSDSVTEKNSHIALKIIDGTFSRQFENVYRIISTKNTRQKRY